MSKILALGAGPLPEAGVRHLSAHCLRTWSLIEPLRRSGHEIALYTLPIFPENPSLEQGAGLEEASFGGLRCWRFLNCNDAFNLGALNQACERFQPDCLLAINSYPSALLSQCASRAPLWADFYGSIVFEGQAAAAARRHDTLLGAYWEMEEAALRRADKFSCVSRRQYYALHGELAAAGRMNRHTARYEFGAVIPAAAADAAAGEAPPSAALARLALPEEAFCLLWSGSYNAWTDADTLFEGIERAMRARDEIHYLSTGGAACGHDDLTYPRFLERVESSPLRQRFHFLGWVDSAELPAIERRADLGLCIDSRMHETVFGSRTRLLNLLAAGVPALATRGSEIADELIEAGCALGVEPDSPKALADGLIAACDMGRERLAAMAAGGRRHVLERFSPERVAQPLLEWAATPALAPDNAFKLRLAPGSPNPFAIPRNPLEQRRFAQLAAEAPRGTVERIKRAVERAMGKERYARLRYFRQVWLRRHWPPWGQAPPEPARLAELALLLGGEAPGGGPGDLALADFEALAPSLPRLETLTLGGGRALRHPRIREIVQLLVRQTRPERLIIASDGSLAAKLESLCGELLEECLSMALYVRISLDGLEQTHNSLRGDPKAWIGAHHALLLMRMLKQRFSDRFDFAALTAIGDKNYRELEPLHDLLRRLHGCRHEFEFAGEAFWPVQRVERQADSASAAAPGLAAPPAEALDGILAALKRIGRRQGPGQRAGSLRACMEAGRLLRRSGKRGFDCAAAGRRAAAIYANGDLALCEFTPPFGNLREHGMDFARAWSSPEADAMRQRIRPCHFPRAGCLSKNTEYPRRP